MEELSEYEQEILDSVLRMYPGQGSVVEKLDKYIAYEQSRVSRSSDGKWHREFLPELEALRAKLAGDVSRRRSNIEWETVKRLLDE
jgi:hypothetical protein